MDDAAEGLVPVDADEFAPFFRREFPDWFCTSWFEDSVSTPRMLQRRR